MWIGQVTLPERLKLLKLETLERRRGKRDLITAFKIDNGLIHIPRTRFFSVPYRMISRTHHHKFYRRWTPNVCKNWFANRIVPIWNSLPRELDYVDSVKSFKALINHIEESKIIPSSLI